MTKGKCWYLALKNFTIWLPVSSYPNGTEFEIYPNGTEFEI